MNELSLRGARVVDPASGVDGIRHVTISDGRITSISAEAPAGQGRRIDLDGLVVTPGLIDMHVHLREPGQEVKETIESGCAAAAAGGFTAVAAMANTDPVNDCREVTARIVAAARQRGVVRVYPVGAVSVGLRGERLAAIAEMVEAGAVALSDDGRPLCDGSLMRRALEYSRVFGIPLLVHEQDDSLVQDGVVNEGAVSTRLGLPGWPAAGEDSMIARDVLLVEDYGGRLHVQHLTTARGLELIRAARRRGVAVTCEATQHHMMLTDEALLAAPFDTDIKMNPPLRTEADRQALVAGLTDGTIDAIATDHAPHHADEKAVPFCCAPFGTIGLEAAVPVCLTRLYHEGHVTLARLVELMSTAPARILGVAGGRLEVGGPADITVLDLDRESTIDPGRFRSLSENCAFRGWSVRGAPVMTLVAGAIVYDAR